MTTQAQQALWPSLAVAASALFWGTTWIPLWRLAGVGIPASWSAVLVYLLPAVAVLPLIAVRRTALRAGGWPLLSVALGVGACNALFAAALTLRDVDVGTVVLLFYLSPVWAAVLERVLYGVPIVRFRLFGIGLGIAGMLALKGLDGRLPLPANLAEWMGLAAGFCWSVGLVAANAGRATSVLDKTALQFLCAAGFGLLLLWLIGSGDALPAGDRLVAALPWLLAASVLWIVPAMGLSLWGAARMSPTRASVILMLEVIVTLVSTAVLKGEEIGLNKLVGGALIAAASLVETLGHAQSERKAAAAQAAGMK